MIEVLMIVAVLIVVGVILLPALVPPRARRSHIGCVNYLKQVGLAFRIWAGDNNDKFPMQVSTNEGGTMEFVGTPDTFRHFQVMSNELNTPKILFCPMETDKSRKLATTFETTFVAGKSGWIPFTSNSNLSYFAGVDAVETNGAMFLSGDRNITNGVGIKSGLLELGTNQPVGWTGEMHHYSGNVGLSDGSVQPVSTPLLREALARTGVATTRLAMP